jgi:hypothetical protein
MDADEAKDLADAFQRDAPSPNATGCPEPERIWAAVFGELPFGELRAITDHSIRCTACSEALRVARDLKASSAPATEASLTKRPAQTRWLIGLALAAGVASLVLVRTTQQRVGDGADLERGATTSGIQSALPKTAQPKAGLVLRWSPLPHVARYSVTLATDDLRVLFQKSGVETAELAVPPTALTGLAPGAHLVWRVEATLEDGRSVESPAFPLDLD